VPGVPLSALSPTGDLAPEGIAGGKNRERAIKEGAWRPMKISIPFKGALGRSAVYDAKTHEVYMSDET